jgi:hypothetical protein
VKIKGTSRGQHRYSGLKDLEQQLENNPALRQKLNEKLGTDVLQHMRSGKSGLKNPPGTELHHPVDKPKILKVLQKEIHRDPELQKLLHPLPNRGGGMSANY